MTSLTDLPEVVDVVVGVDNHVHTHSAAVIDSATGGVLSESTVAATAAEDAVIPLTPTRACPKARFDRVERGDWDRAFARRRWAVSQRP
jgi:hypothetical protein